MYNNCSFWETFYMGHFGLSVENIISYVDCWYTIYFIYHFSPLQLTSEDLRDVGEAIETLGVEKRKLIIEEKELLELKSELADYQEDIEDFKTVSEELVYCLVKEPPNFEISALLMMFHTTCKCWPFFC